MKKNLKKVYRWFFPIRCVECGTKQNVYAETEIDVKDKRPLCDECCYKINGYG
jgi:ribosomal protein S27E